MAIKIQVTIDVIIHATEDVSKIFDAFKEMFDLKKEEFSIQNLMGHFDNPIILLNAKISKKQASNFVKTLVSKMSSNQIECILESIDERLENSGLYLRLDKEEFVNGNLAIQEKNSVKLKIYTPIYKKTEVVKTYSNLLKSVN
ncbi:MAG: RNA-binding domain-containing protein [Nitrosopumilaceae archaeon]